TADKPDSTVTTANSVTNDNGRNPGGNPTGPAPRPGNPTPTTAAPRPSTPPPPPPPPPTTPTTAKPAPTTTPPPPTTTTPPTSDIYLSNPTLISCVYSHTSGSGMKVYTYVIQFQAQNYSNHKDYTGHSGPTMRDTANA